MTKRAGEGAREENRKRNETERRGGTIRREIATEREDKGEIEQG